MQQQTVSGQPETAINSARTCLASIASRNFRTYLLIVNQPLLQTPDDLPSVSKRAFLPRILSGHSEADFIDDVLLVIGNVCAKVPSRRWVETCDVPSATHVPRRH